MSTDTENVPQDPETPAPAEGENPPEDADTFPREYVERLRRENAEHRTAAREAAEALTPTQQRLHGLLVAASGRLADPTDLPFDAAHLDDENALNAAIDDLLVRKPHLASRRVAGDVGQGAGSNSAATVSLAGLLRSGAA